MTYRDETPVGLSQCPFCLEHVPYGCDVYDPRPHLQNEVRAWFRTHVEKCPALMPLPTTGWGNSRERSSRE